MQESTKHEKAFRIGMKHFPSPAMFSAKGAPIFQPSPPGWVKSWEEVEG